MTPIGVGCEKSVLGIHVIGDHSILNEMMLVHGTARSCVPTDFLFDTMRETIALFGTSADPPTIGHEAILAWLSQRYDRVLVWAADNPFKPDQTPLSHRQEMLRLVLSDKPSLFNRVHWMPELSHRWSLTSVEKVRDRWPSACLNLVIGSDILPSLQDWHAIERLMEQVTFVVLHRPGVPIQRHFLDTFRNQGGKIEVAEFVGPDGSSSDFRLRQNLEIVSGPVLEYIQAHNLYQMEDVNV